MENEKLCLNEVKKILQQGQFCMHKVFSGESCQIVADRLVILVFPEYALFIKH